MDRNDLTEFLLFNNSIDEWFNELDSLSLEEIEQFVIENNYFQLDCCRDCAEIFTDNEDLSRLIDGISVSDINLWVPLKPEILTCHIRPIEKIYLNALIKECKDCNIGMLIFLSKKRRHLVLKKV